MLKRQPLPKSPAKAEKKALRHGEFKKWVEKNCEFGYTSAKYYMQAVTQKAHRGGFFVAKAVEAPQRQAKTTEGGEGTGSAASANIIWTTSL